MNKTTYWELSDGRVLRLEDSQRNDLVNDNPLLEAGCQAVLIRDERFTWLEMGGEYLIDFTDKSFMLESNIKRYFGLSMNPNDDEEVTTRQAEKYFIQTYGQGVFVICRYNQHNREHLCCGVEFDPNDDDWWDATAWLVVPDGVAVHTLLDNYTLWMNGCEVQVFDNETGELIEAILTCDHHEKIIHERYDMYAIEKEDI